MRRLITCAAIALALTSALGGCSDFGRAVKSAESNWGGGLLRELRVFDATGDEIYHQIGRFDIQETETGDKVLYDDERGLRHIIYPGSGTVIVNEIEQ